MIIKNTLKNFLPTRYFLESAYAAAVHTITEIAAAVNDVSSDIPSERTKISLIPNKNT